MTCQSCLRSFEAGSSKPHLSEDEVLFLPSFSPLPSVTFYARAKLSWEVKLSCSFSNRHRVWWYSDLVLWSAFWWQGRQILPERYKKGQPCCHSARAQAHEEEQNYPRQTLWTLGTPYMRLQVGNEHYRLFLNQASPGSAAHPLRYPSPDVAPAHVHPRGCWMPPGFVMSSGPPFGDRKLPGNC